MSKFLLTVCAFGLLLSPAFAEEKSREQYREERLHIFSIEGLEWPAPGLDDTRLS
jgi:hypothetical protein